MRIIRFFPWIGMCLFISTLGCANRNACSPYPGYGYPYQAYPYGYGTQPGAPIQASPMVGAPPPAGNLTNNPGVIPTYPVPAAGYPTQPGIPPGYGYSQQPIIGR